MALGQKGAPPWEEPWPALLALFCKIHPNREVGMRDAWLVPLEGR